MSANSNRVVKNEEDIRRIQNENAKVGYSTLEIVGIISMVIIGIILILILIWPQYFAYMKSREKSTSEKILDKIKISRDKFMELAGNTLNRS